MQKSLHDTSHPSVLHENPRKPVMRVHRNPQQGVTEKKKITKTYVNTLLPFNLVGFNKNVFFEKNSMIYTNFEHNNKFSTPKQIEGDLVTRGNIVHVFNIPCAI